MRRPARLALLAGLLLSQLPPPEALAQGAAATEALHGLREAEVGLRDVLNGMEEGRIPASGAVSRLRQALNEVERAMLRLPADSRRGAPWQTAVREVTEALAAVREEGAEPDAARAAAGEALATLPALAGAESGTGG